MDKCICGREKVCSGCKLNPTDCTCSALHQDTGKYSGYNLTAETESKRWYDNIRLL